MESRNNGAGPECASEVTEAGQDKTPQDLVDGIATEFQDGKKLSFRKLGAEPCYTDYTTTVYIYNIVGRG